MKSALAVLLIVLISLSLQAQKVNDSTSPLHLMKPDYDTPYGKPEVKQITAVLDKIYNYLDQTTPMALINRETRAEVTDYSKIDGNTIFQPGDFRLLSYEWGVTYAGMLLATQNGIHQKETPVSVSDPPVVFTAGREATQPEACHAPHPPSRSSG